MKTWVSSSLKNADRKKGLEQRLRQLQGIDNASDAYRSRRSYPPVPQKYRNRRTR